MKTYINNDSLIVGTFPMRKICMVEIRTEDDEDIYQGYVPYYMSSGTNDNKIKGKWYPILGIYYDDEEYKKSIDYLINISCDDRSKLPYAWLIKSPFFVNFEGCIKDDNIIPSGFGNHDYTETLKKISDKISLLYNTNNYTKDNELITYINDKFSNQEDIDYLLQYMAFGKII